MIGDRDVTYLPAKDRDISMVFQSYAIFPHMKVFDNIAFGLRMKKKSKEFIQKRVEEVSALLHIENMLTRYPSQMSGGQRQRIAVARALAIEAKVLLMDEPLSNLDALLRLEMRAELKLLLAKLGATTIYVTHDQIEALSMGDRIAVMQKGRILQYDHPTRVYDSPTHQFVGSFIGNPPMNFIPAQIQKYNGRLVARVGEFMIPPDDALVARLSGYEGKQVWLGIRAENMEALHAPTDDALSVTVQVVEPLGSMNLLTIHAQGETVKLSTHPDFVAKPNDTIWVRFPTNKIRWIDRDSGRAIVPDLVMA
jgi:multiple sugar transport system ATP-binding protein